MELLSAEEIIRKAKLATENIVKGIRILQHFGSNIVLYIDSSSKLSLRFDMIYSPEGEVYSSCDYKINKNGYIKVNNDKFIDGYEYLQARLDLLSNYSWFASEIYKAFLRLKSNLLSELKDKEDLLESLFSDVLVKEKLDEAK
jgi:hypothetical protein